MFTVSSLAKASGLNVDTIRYYARLGLLREAGRTRGGHRYFDDSALERLQFIRGAQWFDLRLDEIRELLDVKDRDGCALDFTQSLLEQKICAIEAQRDRLDRVRSALRRLLDNGGAPGFGAAAMLMGASADPDTDFERELLIRRSAAMVRPRESAHAS